MHHPITFQTDNFLVPGHFNLSAQVQGTSLCDLCEKHFLRNVIKHSKQGLYPLFPSSLSFSPHWCMLIMLRIYAWWVLSAPPLPASCFSAVTNLRIETHSPFHHGPDSSDTSGAVLTFHLACASAPLGISISLSWVQLPWGLHPQHLSVETLFSGYSSFLEIQYLSLCSLCIHSLPT